MKAISATMSSEELRTYNNIIADDNNSEVSFFFLDSIKRGSIKGTEKASPIHTLFHDLP